jgi:hypothetical protein
VPATSKSSDRNVIGVALVEPIESTAASPHSFTWAEETYEAGTTHDYRMLAAEVVFDDRRRREMHITLLPADAVRFSEWTAMNQGRSIGISIDG